MTRRTANWVLVGLLVASWAVLFARGFADGLHNQRGQLHLRVASASSPDAYPVVLRRVTQPEIPAGELIEAVDGVDLRGASALQFYDHATRAARELGRAAIRLSHSGVVREVSVELTPSSIWWLEYVFSVALMLVGVLLALLAPHWPLTRRFAFACWCFAVGGITFESRAGPAGTAFEATFAYLVWGVGSALTIANAQELTASARPVPRWHRLAAVVAAALYFANYVIRFHLPYTPRMNTALVFAPAVWFASAVVAALVRVRPLESRRAPPAPLARARVRRR